jgi:hypothetical protein
MTVRALRSTAQRIQLLAVEAVEAAGLRADLERLVLRWRRGCGSCLVLGRSAPRSSW